LLDGPALHNLACVHHEHSVATLRNDTDVMRDQQNTSVRFLLHLAHQRKKSAPERSRPAAVVGLIGDQQIGLAGECHRDHYPLSLPPRKSHEDTACIESPATEFVPPATVPNARSLASVRETPFVQPDRL